MTNETTGGNAEPTRIAANRIPSWLCPAVMLIGLAVLLPTGVNCLMDWKRQQAYDDILAGTLPATRTVHAGTSYVSACRGDEFFCASLASTKLKDTVQALAAVLPAQNGRYQITLKVEQVIDDFEPPLFPPVDQLGPPEMPPRAVE